MWKLLGNRFFGVEKKQTKKQANNKQKKEKERQAKKEMNLKSRLQ